MSEAGALGCPRTSALLARRSHQSPCGHAVSPRRAKSWPAEGHKNRTSAEHLFGRVNSVARSRATKTHISVPEIAAAL